MDPKVKSAMEQLESGVQQYMTSESYTTYLATMSKFHNYSFYNIMLILMQNPDATHVAGYRAWQTNFHRYVKKGEKGIRILAPAPFKAHRKNADGEDEEILVPNFRAVYVWDVSQTEGEELPSVDVDRLAGNIENYTALLDGVKAMAPYPVELGDTGGTCCGYCSWNDKKIMIQSGMSEVQTVKTAIHELAHSLVHNPECKDAEQDKDTREVQAESIAYVVCNHFGLDTGDYSFPYVASWSGDKSLKELRKSQDVICKTAHMIIETLNQSLAA